MGLHRFGRWAGRDGFGRWVCKDEFRRWAGRDGGGKMGRQGFAGMVRKGFAQHRDGFDGRRKDEVVVG